MWAAKTRARVASRPAVKETKAHYEPDLSAYADEIETLTKNVLD